MPETDQPAPSIGPSDVPRIALPKNLAQTLRFLSDGDLETLRAALRSSLRAASDQRRSITREVSPFSPQFHQGTQEAGKGRATR
jgi:hypothetical protein